MPFDRNIPRPWRAMRAQHLAVYPECRICGTEEDVVVHHIRYRGPRGTSERPGDLMTLCATHHDLLHRKLGTTSKVRYQLEFVREEAASLYV